MTLYLYGIIFILIDFILIKSKVKVPPFFFFFGAFLIMGFQDAIGGDYIGSKSVYEAVGAGKESYRSDEFIWRALVYFFSKIGAPFWLFIAFQAFINTYIISKFTGKYIPDRRFWVFAFTLFYFTFNYMMFHMTGMRQSFSIEMCLLSVILFDEKKYAPSVACFIIARFIHSAAIMMVPVIIAIYFLEKSKWLLKSVSNLYIAIFLIAVFAFAFTNKSLIVDWLVKTVLMQDMGGFENYIRELNEDTTANLIYVYNFILLCLAVYMMLRMDGIYKIFMLMTAISCITSALFVGSGTLYRVFLYFEIFNVVTIPLIVRYFFKINKAIGIVLIIFFISYAFKTSLPFIQGAQDYHHYDNYRFIFQ